MKRFGKYTIREHYYKKPVGHAEESLSGPAIKRLVKRWSQIWRVENNIVPVIRRDIRKFTKHVLLQAAELVRMKHKNTIQMEDILYVLHYAHGIHLYGMTEAETPLCWDEQPPKTIRWKYKTCGYKEEKQVKLW